MKSELIEIRTAFIKLDALLKFAGIAGTGGHAKELITGGRVEVEGQVCTQRGRKILPGLRVSVDGMEYEVRSGAD